MIETKLIKILAKISKDIIGCIFTALVKLFELRIIGCAVGDFSRTPGPAMLFKRIHDPNLNTEVRCGCKGIEIPGNLNCFMNHKRI